MLTGEYIFSLFLSVMLAFCVYTLPFLLYRFFKHQNPFPPKSARKIIIIYCVIAWLVLRIIEFVLYGTMGSGAAVFLWGFVAYRVMIKGWNAQVNSLGADENVREVMLHSECMKYIQSKMTDFGILSADLQDPFQDNIKRTLASIGVDKLVMSNDPVIVKTASYVIIRSALTYLSDTSRKQLTNQKKKAQGVYFLLKDCMNLYISNGYISEENFRFNV